MDPSPSTQAPGIIRRLDRVRISLRLREAASLFLLHALILLGVFLLLALLDLVSPLRESTAGLIGLIVSGGLLGSLAYSLFRTFYRPIPLSRIAERIEQKHPDLMDALVAVADLSIRDGGQAPSARGRVESALLSTVGDRLAGKRLEQAAILPRLRYAVLGGGLAALLLLGFFTSQTSAFQKGLHELNRWLGHGEDGLIVRPGDKEVPIHSDVTIDVEIKRWEREAKIVYSDARGRHEYPLYEKRDGNFRFTFYDLVEPVRYEIITPSLSSPSYTLGVFQPPELRSIEIKVEPPAYTQLPAQDFASLTDLDVIEGSVILFSAETTTPADVRLVTGEDGSPAFDRTEGGVRHEHAYTVKASTDYFLEMRGGDDRVKRTEDYRIEMRADEPPIVEAVQPGKDIRATPEQVLDLVAQASDDFGLSSVSLTVTKAGDEPKEGELFAIEEDEEPIRTTYAETQLRLEQLEVEVGDVISYYFTAQDNKEPEAQSARSEVYFIEIIREILPQQGETMQGESQQMEVRSIMDDLKRLVRLDYELMGQRDAGKDIAEGLNELEAGLGDVRISAQKRLGEISDLTGMTSGFSLIDNMASAVENIERAQEQAKAEELKEAADSMQMALRDLLKVEQELMQNAVNQMAAQQQQQQQQMDQPQQGQQSQNQESQPQPTPEQIKEALEQMRDELRQVANEQQAANQSMQRLSQSAASEESMAEQSGQLAQRQEQINQSAGNVAEKIERFQGAESISEQVRQAQREMERSQDSLEEANPRGAQPSGERARENLLGAAGLLDEILQQAKRQQMEGLAQAASEMAEQQEGAAEQSEQAAQGEGSADADRQRSEQEQAAAQAERLMRAIDRMTGELEEEREDAPAAARMREAAEEAEERDLTGEMQRAANALLYERFERASRGQSQSAEALEELAAGLQEAADALPAMSSEQLAEAMEQLERQRRQMQSAMAEGGEEQEAGNQPSQPQAQNAEQGEAEQEQAQTGQAQGEGEEGEGEQDSSPRGEQQGGQQPGEAPSEERQGRPGADGLVQNSAEMLKNLGDKLSDDELRELAMEMAPMGSTASTENLARAQKVLDEAISLLRQRLMSMEGERRASLNRQSAPPPSEYEELVEEYFKKLGGSEGIQ